MLDRIKIEIKLLNSYGIYMGLFIFLIIISILYKEVLGIKAMEVLRPYISIYCIIAITYVSTIRNKNVREQELLCKKGFVMKDTVLVISLLLPFLIIIFLFQIVIRKIYMSNDMNIVKDFYHNFVTVFFFLATNMFLSKIVKNKWIGATLSFIYCMYSIIRGLRVAIIYKIFEIIENDDKIISLFFVVISVGMIIIIEYLNSNFKYLKEVDR